MSFYQIKFHLGLVKTLIFQFETIHHIFSEKLVNASQQIIKLLEENEADMKKQEAYKLIIGEFEEMLRKYKSSLNDVDQKVKQNIRKIVQSQREMVKRRSDKENSREVLQQIGTMARGDTYM